MVLRTVDVRYVKQSVSNGGSSRTQCSAKSIVMRPERSPKALGHTEVGPVIECPGFNGMVLASKKVAEGHRELSLL